MFELKNKKGILFTVVVIAITFLFLIFYLSKFTLNETRLVNKRINTLDTYVFSTEQDLNRQVYIFGYRSLLIFEKKVMEKGEYVSNLTLHLNELFYNATYDSEIQELMVGANADAIRSTMEENGRRINIIPTFTPIELKFYQVDPWNVKIELIANLFVKDEGDLASWNKTATYTGLIPIYSFHDPLLIVSTKGTIIHNINQTPYATFIEGGDTSNLLDHVSNGYYLASNEAPDYLGRLSGNSSSSPFGIESLVYLPELSSQGIIAEQKSVVDHVYYSTNNPLYSSVSGMPSWFYLDSAHFSKYNATI